MEVIIVLAGALALIYGPGLAEEAAVAIKHQQWLEA